MATTKYLVNNCVYNFFFFYWKRSYTKSIDVISYRGFSRYLVFCDRPGEGSPEKNCFSVTDVSTTWAGDIFRVIRWGCRNSHSPFQDYLQAKVNYWFAYVMVFVGKKKTLVFPLTLLFIWLTFIKAQVWQVKHTQYIQVIILTFLALALSSPYDTDFHLSQ